jgi:cobalamin biosynthesis protein CobT
MEELKDENQAEDETITHPDEGNLAEYNAILTPLRRELNYLVQHLYSLVAKKRQKRRRRAFVRNRERGVVDSGRLWKLCAGKEDVFKERRVGDDSLMAVDPDSLAVYLLVDESHSMLEMERYVRAREAAVILCEALDRLGMTFALTGYTASGKLSRILYKQFDESYTDVKTRLLGMRHRMGTLTAEHIPFALRRLEKRNERKRILIVVTDSTDIESPVRLREAILDAKEADIELIGVGVHTNLMSDYYGIFIEITDISDFARQLLELLKSVLQR